MGLDFVAKLGLMFLMIATLDVSAAALWSVGRKEQTSFFVKSRGKRRFKRHKGQKWWARRLWDVSSFLKCLLFYVALIAYMNGKL